MINQSTQCIGSLDALQIQEGIAVNKERTNEASQLSLLEPRVTPLHSHHTIQAFPRGCARCTPR